jgi:hypothetical protein
MRSRSIVMAILLLCGSQALADPPKSAPAHPAPSQQTAHAIVLASAETVQAEAPQPAPAQPKHRFARVTTCRCGDPQPDNVTDKNSDQ